MKFVKSKKQVKSTKKTNKRDGSGKVIFLGILLAFLLAASVFLGYFKLKSFFISEEVTVPKITGMQEEQAKKEIEDLGLKFEVVGRKKSSEFKAGEVMTQNEEENAKVKKGYTIEVTVSDGDNLVKVLDVVNRDLADAERNS